MKEIIAEYVGKKALIYAGGLNVEVVVTDVKQAWGKTRYQVKPVAGTGEVWVETVSIIK